MADHLVTGQSEGMNQTDATLSHDVTAALNASVPDVVTAAGQSRRATTLLLAASSIAVLGGLGAAIFGPALADTPSPLAIIGVVLVVVIVMMTAALVVGLRAKRAFRTIAETVRREHQATLVRVAGGQVHVRR